MRVAVRLVWVALLVALAAPARSQVTVAPPPAAPIVTGLESEGRVTRVDRAARTITLDGREDYVIPAALDAAWAVVRDGSAVRIRYNVDGGRNIVTHLQVVQ